MNRGEPPIRDEARRQAELALRERVRQLERAIAQEHAKPAGEQRRQALELFSAELIDAERAYQNSLDALSASDPAYAAARSLSTVSSDAVQKLLPPDSALLEYVVADEGVSIFVIRAAGIQAKTIPAEVDRRRGEGGTAARPHRARTWPRLAGPRREPAPDAGCAPRASRLARGRPPPLHRAPRGPALRAVRGAAARQGAGRRLVVNEYVVAYLPAAAALVQEDGNGEAAETVMAMAPARTGSSSASRRPRPSRSCSRRNACCSSAPRPPRARSRSRPAASTSCTLRRTATSTGSTPAVGPRTRARRA